MVRLFVGGLPPDVDEEALRARFSSFGDITEVGAENRRSTITTIVHQHQYD